MMCDENREIGPNIHMLRHPRKMTLSCCFMNLQW